MRIDEASSFEIIDNAHNIKLSVKKNGFSDKTLRVEYIVLNIFNN
jgi:hypothetical protein